VQALAAWRFLSNGMGGFDMGAGLDTVVALLGVADVEGLLYRLVTIKTHRPPKGPEQTNG